MTRSLAVAPSPGRRWFLARCGVLGAALVTARPVAVLGAGRTVNPKTGHAALLNRLTTDAISGLVAFVVPGRDPYSFAQGMAHHRPGGVDAGAVPGVIEAFDRFLAVPPAFASAAARAFARGIADRPPASHGPATGATAVAVADRALVALEAAGAVPLSLIVALMVNFVATEVNAAAVGGRFPGAPFANLGHAEKAEVFRRLEGDHAALAAMLDRGAPEPYRAAFSGEITLLGGILPAAAGLYSYCEYGALERARGLARRRPLGWDLTNYAPGRATPADGWDELRGYYRGHRSARPARSGSPDA